MGEAEVRSLELYAPRGAKSGTGQGRGGTRADAQGLGRQSGEAGRARASAARSRLVAGGPGAGALVGLCWFGSKLWVESAGGGRRRGPTWTYVSRGYQRGVAPRGLLGQVEGVQSF